MSPTITCSRCKHQRPPLERPPLPGALGEEIRSHVCAECWQEWRQTEVMVINELRLNFMDPAAQEVLNAHLREFLNLPAGGSATEHS